MIDTYKASKRGIEVICKIEEKMNQLNSDVDLPDEADFNDEQLLKKYYDGFVFNFTRRFLIFFPFKINKKLF